MSLEVKIHEANVVDNVVVGSVAVEAVVLVVVQSVVA